MLKTTNMIFALSFVVISWQMAQAQAPMTTNDYYIMRQQVVGAAANQANGSAATVEAIGEKRIKAGNASVSFIANQAVIERYTKSLTFDSDEPQTFPEQLNLMKDYVKRFDEMLAAAGGKINNCADAYALAYGLSYLAYYDEAPNTAEVKSLRQKYIKEKLSDASFQGMSDADRQWYYISWAMTSMQAIDWREKASRATSSRARRGVEEKAKLYANYILEIK